MSKSQTKQKKSSAGRNVAVFFIVFVILEALLIYGLTRVFENEDSYVSIGGYSFFIMDTSNMSSDVPKNALVIASNGTPSTDKTGYAVLCKNVGDEGTTVAWLYDIGSKGDTVDGVVYTVYQEIDTSTMYDLPSEDIIGVTTSYYLTAGQIIAFATTTFGMAACVAIPIIIMIFLEIIIAVAHSSKNKDYDDDDYDDDEDEEENVTIDDFLYGGEGDEVYTTGKPKDTYEEEFEDKYASLMNRQTRTEPELESDYSPIIGQSDDEPEELAEDQLEADYKPEQVSEPEQTVEESPKTEIDSSYYERASKLIDDAAADTQKNDEPESQEAVVTEEPQAAEQTEQTSKEVPEKPQHEPKKPQQTAKKRPRPRQDANAALEQLMKMMEAEQEKLKQTTSINDTAAAKAKSEAAQQIIEEAKDEASDDAE
ncbi:MAG: hypothetical protein LUE12_03175 [Ruminococcus sp.]|nr:hypothetical protein [Ruminococcus sp.]